MGMSTHVVGFKPPDDKFKKMKAAWDACRAAGIEPPEEVYDFFGGESPDANGVVVEIEKHACCSKWSEDMQDGYEIDVSKLPKDVKIVRFYNSW